MTLVGTCAVCEREIAVRPNAEATGKYVLVHHGYRRPGFGSIVGDCFAVALPPHELSNEAAVAYRDFAVRCLEDCNRTLGNLREGRVEILYNEELVPVPTTGLRPDRYHQLCTKNDPGWRNEQIAYTPTETSPERRATWLRLVEEAIRRQEHQRDFYTSELVRIERFIAPWTPGTLREREEVVPDPTKRRRRRGYRAW